MSRTSTPTLKARDAEALSYAPPGALGSLWRRTAADLRPPLWALTALAAVMCVGFPSWRMGSPREMYILHLSDDAFYYLSVAPHIAAGHGPTADGITRTTGWHPLYGFVLAGLYRVANPSLDGFVKAAIALDSVLYLLSAALLYLAGRAWWGRPAGVAAGLLWLCNPYGVLIAQQGLESSLYALTLSLLLWRFAKVVSRPAGVGLRRVDSPRDAKATRQGNALLAAGEYAPPAESPQGTERHEAQAAAYLRSCAELGLCTGLVVLSRTDAVLLVPLLAAILWMHARRTGAGDEPGRLSRAAAVGGMAVFALLVMAAYGAWLAYVWHYTHELNQGSAAVKMEWRRFLMSERTVLGAMAATLAMWGEYAGGTLVKVPALKWVLTGIPILVAAARPWAVRGLLHLLWVMPVVLGAAYSLLLDWTRAWYYMPGLLSLTLLSAGAAAALLRAPVSGTGAPAAGSRGRQAIASLQLLVKGTAGLIAWAVVIESAAVFAHGVYEEFDADSEKRWALRAAAWLERNAEPGARIGCWHSGILGYYTPSLNVINLDGLNNNEILAILRGRKTLNAYWDERRISILVGRPSEKMGSYAREWGDQRVVRWSEAPDGGVGADSLSIDEQVFRQMFQRVIKSDHRSAVSSRPERPTADSRVSD